MSMTRFRAQPMKGHLARAKQIFSCLSYLPEGVIRFHTHEPDYSSVQEQEFEWTRSVSLWQCEGTHITLHPKTIWEV